MTTRDVDRHPILDIEITPELEAELLEFARTIELSEETKRRMAAFDTPIHWTTWYKIVP